MYEYFVNHGLAGFFFGRYDYIVIGEIAVGIDHSVEYDFRSSSADLLSPKLQSNYFVGSVGHL